MARLSVSRSLRFAADSLFEPEETSIPVGAEQRPIALIQGFASSRLDRAIGTREAA
jgi:hypothetical protein